MNPRLIAIPFALVILVTGFFVMEHETRAGECDFILEQGLAQIIPRSPAWALLTGPEIAPFLAKLPSKPDGEVTAVLVFASGAGAFYGLEIGGCLLPPEPMPEAKPAVMGTPA